MGRPTVGAVVRLGQIVVEPLHAEAVMGEKVGQDQSANPGHLIIVVNMNLGFIHKSMCSLFEQPIRTNKIST